MTLVRDCEFQARTFRLERRRGRRVVQARPAAVFDPVTGRLWHGMTRDLSDGGTQLAFDGGPSLRPGRILRVSVGNNPGSFCLPDQRLAIPARVVWVTHDPDTSEGHCGLEFLTTIYASIDAA